MIPTDPHAAMRSALAEAHREMADAADFIRHISRVTGYPDECFSREEFDDKLSRYDRVVGEVAAALSTPQPTPLGTAGDAAPQDALTAREMLAAEYERDGNVKTAQWLRSLKEHPQGYVQTLRAIERALATRPVIAPAVGEEIKRGDTYINKGDVYHCSGIDVGDHGNRIECFGSTEQDAELLRDRVLAALAAVRSLHPTKAGEKL